MTAVRGIIFDLDGTLLDTLEDIADAANFVLREHGFPEHAAEAYRYFVGDGVQTLLWRVLPEERRDQKTFQSCLDMMKQAYLDHLNKKTKVYGGVRQLLEELHRLGLRLAVLSNKPETLTVECVRHFFGDGLFDPVMGQTAGRPRKPDPTAAKFVAAQWGCAPADILFLGDTSTDMRTAVAAGMGPIGALWGFRSEAELTQTGAIRCLSRPHELLECLQTGPEMPR